MSTPRQPLNSVFPVPYQVDFSVEAKGRHLDSTKRKLTWKVGFAHPPAVFPHLYDANENYIGDGGANDVSVIPYPGNPKKGVECRGREHEIILTWSILTGKAHIYVDSREIIRQAPAEDSILGNFSSSFQRGFNLPNPKFNGHHRIDIRCYARTPRGAKTDDTGRKFRQYDLLVDGLSFHNMPAMFELGMNSMWGKVSRWGLTWSSQVKEGYQGGGGAHRGSGGGTKSRQRDNDKYGQVISKNEYKAMNPRSESDEDQMMRIAREASLKDWEKNVGYGKESSSGTSPHRGTEENDSASGNRQKSSRGRAQKQNNGANNLSAIGEHNMIDFGADDATRAMSHISISRARSSDVSVLDDDATTASFVMNTAWNSNDVQESNGVQQQQPGHQPLMGQTYANQQPAPYQDPTFRAQYAQNTWNSTGNISSNIVTPTNSALLSSGASFAVPPPPTWDDYNDAFGGSTSNMGASVMGGSTAVVNPMSPASSASVGMTPSMAQQYQQQPMQYGMQQQQQQQPMQYGVQQQQQQPLQYGMQQQQQW